MIRRLILATVTVAALGLPGSPADAAPSGPPAATTKPCKYEDSVNCYWDSTTRGNGKGHSFTAIAVPGARGIVCVFYTQRWYARHHDYCS